MVRGISGHAPTDALISSPIAQSMPSDLHCERNLCSTSGAPPCSTQSSVRANSPPNLPLRAMRDSKCSKPGGLDLQEMSVSARVAGS